MRSALFNVKSAMNLVLGVGSKGQSQVRVVVHRLSDIGDPVVKQQAMSEAVAVARVAETVTGTRVPVEIEVYVITNIYPLNEEKIE